ncbi:hypothetical protein BDZ94DRAFT_1301433 [Collybia nuda]|uniref:DUF6535 domain-containing protein n=1 Tax=Collybia nuda TaxID=64659 RepID=A0A9P6CAB4_9AGAR|nr:hypothetical protein BDZ94DRAFT_1301433 [Collybia nuda]
MSDKQLDIEKLEHVAGPHEEETKLGSTRDRMWTLYMKQAGAFDRHMVEDWKGVMEGTLIFSGLFSAVVTTFMVESLRKLTGSVSPEGAGGLPAVGSKVPISSPSYVAINALWSLSLSFALGCAISATLVQQWARSYLHAVDNQHQPPHKRALIRAYMFEGVVSSHMTIAIEGIPILLHASLFLFLIGLIIYFYGINPLIAYPIMAVFIVSVTMYLIPTCMPLIQSNFSFHTPLSTPIWWFWRVVWHKDKWSSAKPMEITREYDATHENRSERSYDAIVWILRQSDEDREFEELLHAIAGFKGPNGSSHPSGRHQVARLVRNYPVEILLRAYTLLKSCGRFSKKPDNRATVIMRAIPALAVSWHIIGSWGHSKAVTSLVDQKILSRWPLEMLETIDKAVAGNKVCFTESDLVLSTYRILLRIIIWAGDPKEVVTWPLHANQPAISLNKLDFDHDMDNIKAAKQIGKSANDRPFDLIIDALISSDFRQVLSHHIEERSGVIPSYQINHLKPYLAMLDFLFKTGESTQQHFFQTISGLELSPELDGMFRRIATLMGDDQKYTRTHSEKLTRLQGPSRKFSEGPPSPKSPIRPRLKHTESTRSVLTIGVPTGGSQRTLTDNNQFQFSPQTVDVAAKIGTGDLSLGDDLNHRNSISTSSTVNDNN